MLVARKLPILPQSLTALFTPTQPTDTLTTPLLAEYSIEDVTRHTSTTIYFSCVYQGSVGC